MGDGVAVVVGIAHGHDPAYPFKAIGAAEGPVITCERGRRTSRDLGRLSNCAPKRSRQARMVRGLP